jgi:hypothetical protein
MKWIKKCPLFLILVISGVLFTLAGIIGKNSIYKDYEYHFADTPFLALTLEGISKGEYPWESLRYGSVIEAVSGALNLPIGSGEDEELETNALVAEGDSGNLFEEAIPAGDAGEEAASGEERVDTTYDFVQVEEEYFDDSVFIGDSRTVGLFEYGGMEERCDFFAKTSLTIYDVFTEPIVKDEETGDKITVEAALQKKQYGKIYLMLGINELGTGTTESFMAEYKKVVGRLEELQPDAIIFVEGIMRVAGVKNETDPIFNNTNINERNEAIEKIADNKKIFYIDVNEAVCDAQGNLEKDYTTDEIHLKAQYYEKWKQFLLSKGIVREEK